MPKIAVVVGGVSYFMLCFFCSAVKNISSLRKIPFLQKSFLDTEATILQLLKNKTSKTKQNFISPSKRTSTNFSKAYKTFCLLPKYNHRDLLTWVSIKWGCTILTSHFGNEGTL